MASQKKKHKQSSIDRKLKRPIDPKRPKDGDRRHRGTGNPARLEKERKETAQQWNLDVGWTDAPDPSESQTDD
jgi:hypothetical protein